MVNFLDANNAEQGAAPEGHHCCQGTVRHLARINRSRLPGKGGGVVIKFHDRDVCKYTLCGVCPHRLFSNTKSDMGSCSYAICGAENPKMSDPLKEWNKLPQNEKDKYGYEYNTMLYLQKLVRGCDNKIVQSKRRLEAEDRPATMAELNEDDKQKLVEIAQQMQDKTLEAQKFGDEENISEALRIMQEIDVLNKRRKAITEGGGAVAAGIKQNESKLIVCEVTGHYYSSMDGEERMALYFQGKQYRGWKRLREYLQKLEQQRPPRGLREYEERSDRNGRGGSNGDEWYCEQCNTSNFADRYKCRKCRAPKPGGRGRDLGGDPDRTSVNDAKSGLALSVVGQTSWIGRVAEIVELQKLVVTPGFQILVVVEGISTAIIEEMETGMGATEVEAEIIVTIGGATGVEDMVNGMRRVKEGGKLCDRVF